jgi:hypothetical protein
MNQQPMMQPPPQKGNGLKIALIVIAVLFVVGGASCVGCYYYAKSKVTELGDSIADGGAMTLVAPKEVVDALAGPKKDYVGDWSAKDGSTLEIDAAGNLEMELKGAGTGASSGSSKTKMAIASFVGDDFTVKLFMSITYKVSKPPTKTADGYEMTVNGKTYTRH